MTIELASGPATKTWDGAIWDRPGWLTQAVKKSEPLAGTRAGLQLLPIFDHPGTGSFTLNGIVVITIKEFNAKRLKRDIHMFKDGQAPQEIPQPSLSAAGGATAEAPGSPTSLRVRTRWDVMLSKFFKRNGGRQRMTIGFSLEDQLLQFLWDGHFPITAKNVASQRLLANPRYDSADGRWVSVDLLFDPANPELQGTADYNVGVIVTDEKDSSFNLPIIIDPRAANEG